ncbi:uncharacterized protein B0H18DRAFT_977377 [Fomitopsis serialis]|uniref:uncharacterized protein n=1 Tax=Fomitopsis serialis TaxID=139415 RepID=UPI002007D752|nr:uncharacterized protein B0H18DRAFT_977377 [Neoantrodia serialis]KAH9934617.1 hypothetical protein B0H18DRAFT_977377 [Neoantrodia serialis]
MLSLCLVPLSLSLLVSASLHRSLLPQDPYAFPKYRVAYVNGLPVLNETAERWLREGLKGGQAEFLDETWEWSDTAWHSGSPKSIEGGAEQGIGSTPAPDTRTESNYSLELMRLGPRMTYLYESTATIANEPEPDVSPLSGWSLLQPLNGKCLYHRQGWFTYAYCHNSHVRQFHELPQQANNRQDAEWEAYTLGRAPPTPEPGADLTVAEQAAIAANVELARGARSHYLVQRWGDGSHCDKTGKKREIEVQFHCSMTMTDTILFVKETLTCHYVLHIATPRLCGVPGFKSRVDDRNEAFIRCREILDEAEYQSADRSLQAADRPLKVPKKTKPVIAPPPPEPATEPKVPRDIIRQALAKFLEKDAMRTGPGTDVFVEDLEDDNGEVMIEFIDLDLDLDLGGEDLQVQLDAAGDQLADALRAAGYGVKDEKRSDEKGSQGKGTGKKKTASKGNGEGEAKPRRDEL